MMSDGSAKVIDVAGTARDIGRQSGEALREEIRALIEFMRSRRAMSADDTRLGTVRDAIRGPMPEVWEELEGTAEGAAVPLHEVVHLNAPPAADRSLDALLQTCTNVAFADGPDGPLWGKNNDRPMHEGDMPFAIRRVRPKHGLPALLPSYCGMLGTADAMNAAGLAVGHSSVGSRFQSSDRFVPILLWAYAGMMRCRTTGEFCAHIASRPTTGKGFSMVVVDANGAATALEAPCPIAQVLPMPEGRRQVNCVNVYQLPSLADVDNRTPLAKCNAQARAAFLHARPDRDEDRSLAAMESLLRHHGDVSICRHGDEADPGRTEYSFIGVTARRELRYRYSRPCDGAYHALSF